MNKIIILDDDEKALSSCKKALIDHRISETDIICIGTRISALEALAEHTGNIQAFVSDYDLGNNTDFGNDVIRVAKEKYPGLNCILMSSAIVLDLAGEVGARYWKKNFNDFDRLLEFIKTQRMSK